jgi:hypothetical protein
MEDSDSGIKTYRAQLCTVECYFTGSSVTVISRINFPLIFLQVSTKYISKEDASQLFRCFTQ